MGIQALFKKKADTATQISKQTKIPVPIVEKALPIDKHPATLSSLKLNRLTQKVSTAVIAASLCTTFYGLGTGKFSLNEANKINEKIELANSIPDQNEKIAALLKLQEDLVRMAILVLTPAIAAGTGYLARGASTHRINKVTKDIRDTALLISLERITTLEDKLATMQNTHTEATIDF